MFSSPTVYRSGSRTVEVLPGESHSAAWMYVARGGPRPGAIRATPSPARSAAGCTARAAAGRISGAR